MLTHVANTPKATPVRICHRGIGEGEGSTLLVVLASPWLVDIGLGA